MTILVPADLESYYTPLKKWGKTIPKKWRTADGGQRTKLEE